MIWLNGQLLPDSEARVSVYDSSLMFGDMVFEFLRTFGQRPFKLVEHLKRLLASAKMAQIDVPYSLADLEKAHDSLLEANRGEFAPDDEFRTLINVSRGTLPMYQGMVPQREWVMMTCFNLKIVLKGTSEWYNYGVDGFIASQRAIPSYLVSPRIKHRSRLYLKMAALEAESPRQWPILLDPDGFISEGTGSNIFLVKNRRVYTPEARNCLDGISRRYVMGLLERQGKPVIEQNLDVYDVMMADELFFTNTPNCIMPCTSINRQIIGNRLPGPITLDLMDQWEKNVGCRWREQSSRWDRNNAVTQ